MSTRIQIKRGTTNPSGLTTGEFAYNVTNSTLYIGNTADQKWIGGEVTGGVDMGAGSAASQNRVPTQNSVYQYARNNFVHRLNGITGGITLNAGTNITITSSVAGGITIASSDTVGVTAGDAVTWTQLQRFPAGISAHGATLSGTVTAPTQAIGTNNTTVATTAFVQNEIIADTVTSVNGATGAITNVARTNAGNTFSVVQVFDAGVSAAGGITLSGSLTGVTATFNGLVHAASGVSAPTGNFRQISIPRQAVSSAASRISIGTYGSISETASGGAYIQGNAVAASTASGTNEIIKTSSNSDKGNFIRMRYDQGVSIHTGISGTVGTTFADNENQRFRIDNDGNTTIGTGNNTGYTLDVKGTINATGLIRTVGGISADGALTFNGTITGATATFSRLVTGNAGFSGALTGTATNASALGGTAAASWALLASPTFTGTPAAPTPAIGTNTTQIATTAFVQNEIIADTVTTFNGRTGSVQGVSAAVSGDGISVSGATGSVTITNTGVTRAVAGTGIGLNANTGTVTITNNGVQSFNGSTGAVTGVSRLNGYTGGLTLSAGKGIAFTQTASGITIGNLWGEINDSLIDDNKVIAFSTSTQQHYYSPVANLLGDYVSTFNGRTGAVQGVSAAVAGDGISVSGATGSVTFTNTGVTRAIAGTGIGLNANTGTVTITNNGVQSFNGRTGAVDGASLGANTFSGLQTSSTGFSGPLTGNVTGTATNASSLGGTAAASWALLASPTFTGIPAAPTPAIGTNTTQIATTAFVQNEIVADTVTSFNGRTGSVQGVSAAVAGNGISVSGATGSVTITNTGVTRAVAGTGIGLNANTGTVTITNNGVQSFNGNTGAVTGASLGANTFTGLQTSSTGFSGPLTGTATNASALGGTAAASWAQLAAPNTFTVLNTFTTGISAAGGITFANDIGVNSLTVGRGGGSLSGNVAIGTLALSTNGLGGSNTGVGDNALRTNSGGSNNTAIGNDALRVVEGGANTAVGNQALRQLLTGGNNVAVGFAAGRYGSTGPFGTTVLVEQSSDSVFIGSDSRPSNTGTTAEIVIGANAVGLGSNTAVIGATTQSAAFIYGMVHALGGISAAGATINGPLTGATATFSRLVTGNAGFSGALTGTATNASSLGGTAAASWALLASPTFTGTPAAPTPAIGTNTTQIATTAFVQSEIVADTVTSVNGATGAITNVARTNLTNSFSVLQTFTAGISAAGGVTLASPNLTGTPTSTTAAVGTNTTQIATTAFVQNEIVADTVTSIDGVTGAITNVARKNTDNAFSAVQTFTAGISASGGITLNGPITGVTATFSRLVTGNAGFSGALTGAVTGNASTATALQTARGFSLSGDVTAPSVNFDGTGSVTLNTAIAAGVIVDADINAAANIAVTKLAANKISGITLGNNLNTLTIGTGLGGGSYDGSSAVTITNNGVQSFNGSTGTIQGVSSIVAGTNISITPTGGTGAVTVNVTGAVTTNTSNTFTAVQIFTAGLSASGGVTLASPNMVGTPTAPTAAVGTNTTQIATTAFVQSEIIADTVTSIDGVTGAITNVARKNTDNAFSALQTFTAGISAAGGITFNGNFNGATATFSRLVTGNAGFSGALTGTATNASALGGVAAASYAQLASPAFTGTPTSTTAAIGTNTTQIATTAFVQNEIVADTVTTFNGRTGAVGISAGTNITITQSGNTFTIASTASGGGITAGDAVTWTQLQTFNSGISAAGGVTFSGHVQGTTASFSGHVGIGAGGFTTAHRLFVNGSFAAITKSFYIDHPTQHGKKLQHASLEGPENGVYVRGRSDSNIIYLPEYWSGLVDESTITVHLTPIGKRQDLWVAAVDIAKVIVYGSDTPSFYYTVWGERKDVPRLEVEV